MRTDACIPACADSIQNSKQVFCTYHTEVLGLRTPMKLFDYMPGKIMTWRVGIIEMELFISRLLGGRVCMCV